MEILLISWLLWAIAHAFFSPKRAVFCRIILIIIIIFLSIQAACVHSRDTDIFISRIDISIFFEMGTYWRSDDPPHQRPVHV